MEAPLVGGPHCLPRIWGAVCSRSMKSQVQWAGYSSNTSNTPAHLFHRRDCNDRYRPSLSRKKNHTYLIPTGGQPIPKFFSEVSIIMEIFLNK